MLMRLLVISVISIFVYSFLLFSRGCGLYLRAQLFLLPVGFLLVSFHSSRGFLRIAATLAREGLAARFSESPHQVQIILRGLILITDFSLETRETSYQASRPVW